ncbi:MAG: outer membrane beta-barrel protein [Hyphomonadaceae bacterium]|nr:outer membrane beta-barrel protein [Hyphomonadaceae bacterium]
MLNPKRPSIISVASIGIVCGYCAATPAAAGDVNGNFQIKLGVTGVYTDDHTKSLSQGGVNILPGNGATTDDTYIPSATLTYYFTKNWAVELLCCADRVSVKGTGGLASLGEIANTWVFPPLLTVQYHFDGFGRFRPYVGAGVQWVHYFRERTGSNGLGATSVDFQDSFGPALQVGFDYDLGGGWSLGLDVKKVFEDTKITWTTAGAPIVAKHDIDPLFVTANIGYRFNLEDLFRSPRGTLK